jgi:DNA polymerase elongation subunit (family B)
MKEIAVFDVETYRNFWCVCFKTLSGKTKTFEKSANVELDYEKLAKFLNGLTLVSFNGNGYDIPIITLALNGASNQDLKMASDRIIQENLKPYQFYRTYGLKKPELDHIDLIEIPIGQSSLKLYGGRLHCKLMQDLPIEPDAVLDEDEIEVLKKYCINDLDTTLELYKYLLPAIDLRGEMSKLYDIDLRSKSDAQIAEAVLVSEVSKMVGYKVKRSEVYQNRHFFYNIPEKVKFRGDNLNAVLDMLRSEHFLAKTNNVIDMPEVLETTVITIGTTNYQMGMGGLHSTESEQTVEAGDGMVVRDQDVASYYPRLIINLGLFPDSMGPAFLEVYKTIVAERLAAKALQQELKSKIKELKNSENLEEIAELEVKLKAAQIETDTKKLCINGSFGKLGSIYSALYAPELMVQVTLTGQLYLLMLIEKLEAVGIKVVSANTDGIVMYYHEDYEQLVNNVIKKWEEYLNLETEETRYKMLASRDVNNYIAVKTDLSYKAKGTYRVGDISKNPSNDICNIALAEYLANGKPFEDTIRECKDITKFVTIRTVKGGAVKDGKYLGKAVRWYYSEIEAGKAARWHYSETESGIINYKINGNKVPMSEGARPLMVLPETFPNDVNYDWYIKKCKEELYKLGVKKRFEFQKVPRKNTKAWKELAEQGLLEEFDDKFAFKDDIRRFYE